MKTGHLFIFTILSLTFFICIADAEERVLTHRWVYVSKNLLVDKNVTEVNDICRRAAKAGYTGIVLADYKFNILGKMNTRYFDNVAKVQKTAEQLGLELIPTVMPIGYSNGLLSHDPNLAEGMPVRDALFVVHDGTADIVADPPIALPNGDFEQTEGHKFSGWDWQENVGRSVFADTETVHAGRVALRMENIGKENPEHGNCRLHKLVKVSPFRCYHVEVWIKTENFEHPNGIKIAVLTPDGKSLSYKDLRVKRTQDWTLHHVIFNSLEYTQVRIYLGVWGGKGGALWWDDANIEEVGLLNVLRRPGCPLVVRSEDDTVYEEGKGFDTPSVLNPSNPADFEPIRDERLGTVPWAGGYELYHQPPVITLTPNSRIREGERLRVSFYHPVVIYGGQVMTCLSEPKVYELLKDQVQRVQQLLQPKAFFMSHDEMRVANWCVACQSRKLSPGELLADNVKRCVQIIREVNPTARIYVWSDMFDPNHNAHDNYYLVNGSWTGSWESLLSDVIVVNWYYKKRQKSLPWFANRGHQQILAGYYDNEKFYTPQWLRDGQNIPGIIGVMYTTWRNNYDDLEGFANAVW